MDVQRSSTGEPPTPPVKCCKQPPITPTGSGCSSNRLHDPRSGSPRTGCAAWLCADASTTFATTPVDGSLQLLEAPSPTANSALECAEPGYGYICPANAFTSEMRRRGFDTALDANSAAWGMVAPSVWERLGLTAPAGQLDKPVYAPDIVRDNDGNLLAVRPRRPTRKAKRPTVEEAIAHLDAHPEGVSVAAFRERFGIGDATARRVVDEINPELIYLGSERRCVRRRGVDTRYVFAIIDNRDEIDRCFSEYCRLGHEIDVDCVGHRPSGLILDSRIKTVW